MDSIFLGFLDLKYEELEIGQHFRKFSLVVLHSLRGALDCYFCDDMQVPLDLFLLGRWSLEVYLRNQRVVPWNNPKLEEESSGYNNYKSLDYR